LERAEAVWRLAASVHGWWSVDAAVVSILVVVVQFELSFVGLVGRPASVTSGVSCIVVVVVAGRSEAGFWAGVIFAQEAKKTSRF
jgi:hypothetical protein